MKDKSLKIGLAVAGVFSTALAVREAMKAKKMMEDTKEERSERAAKDLDKVREEWKNQDKSD